MNCAISVIIPVYNVEKTLDRCMKSVLNQTFKDFEIILVDDGSPDNSGKLCDAYAEKYDFVRVIHKENEGLGPTRNRGVKEASGTYIYHCDSDDWIKPETLEDAYNAAVESDADVVLFGYTMYTEKDGVLTEYAQANAKKQLYSDNSSVIDFFIANMDNYFIVQSACNRLVKRAFLLENEIWFKPFRRSQDVVFAYDLFDKINRLSVLDKPYYEYVIEPGVYKGRSFEEMIDIFLSVYELCKQHLIDWQKYTDDMKQKIASMYCAQIANYLSFYVCRKADTNGFAALKSLLKNERVLSLYATLDPNKEKSRFVRSIRTAIRAKSRIALYVLLKMHSSKQK